MLDIPPSQKPPIDPARAMILSVTGGCRGMAVISLRITLQNTRRLRFPTMGSLSSLLYICRNEIQTDT